MRDDLRNALSRVVAACRRELGGDRKKKDAGDIGATLEAPYGFDPRTGVPRPMEQMTHLRASQRTTAEMLREWHRHLATSAAGASEAERARAAYDEMKYEIGYTVVHRLCALRMAEERGILRESVRAGIGSEGFRVYMRLADTALGSSEDAYPVYLNRLYDELSSELPSVFDRRSAASLITPTPRALGAVLAAINSADILDLWQEDETLGWIFEDYNDADERKEMREHDAPRNARELAVRNQFFTPRWVVEFLTDNTLGRLWFELTGGRTSLAEKCRFLLKPEVSDSPSPRDPRSFRVLDPACGSGHFLLYVFDLLETIYLEAWEGRVHRSDAWTPLWEEFADEAALKREIPRLILAHNLHGVDIDPRCIQEAGLALWLRAHRSWNKQGWKAKERPAITEMHLVAARALPNDEERKKRLRERLNPPFLGELVDKLFAKIGEMGVLLRAETAVADTVASLKKRYVAWKHEQRGKSGVLFAEFDQPRQTTLEEFAEVQAVADDEGFWREAEDKVLAALGSLAEEEEEKEHYRSRLFAEAVRHGVEFFDISRIKYDVVLMNPPFGEPTESTTDVLSGAYPNASSQLDSMFYERTLEMLASGGLVGAITKRAWLTLPSLSSLRQRIAQHIGHIVVAADLGYGALNAKVETAAIVVGSGADPSRSSTWVRLVKTRRKSDILLEALRAGSAHRSVSVVNAKRFDRLPAFVFGYWMSDSLVSRYAESATFEGVGGNAKVGAESGDDERFIRAASEVAANTIGLGSRWLRIAKGGEYRPYWDDVHLVIRGSEPHPTSSVGWRRGSVDWFGQPGVTWQQRTNFRLSPRALPLACAFGHKGPAAFAPEGTSTGALLATLNSTASFLLLLPRLQTTDFSPSSISKSYEIGLVRELPWPSLGNGSLAQLDKLAREAVEIVRLGQIEDDDTGESVVAFAIPPVLLPLSDGTCASSLPAATSARVAAREDRVSRLAAIQAEIDDIVARAYGFSERDRQVMDEELEPPLASLPGTEPIDEQVFKTSYLTKEALDGARLPGGLDAEMDVRVEHRRKKQVKLRDEATLCRLFQAPPARIAEARRSLRLLRKEDLHRAAADIVSYAVGAAFGRWDVRLAAHPEWIPTFRDAFDPLPPCPLGQLVNAEGLPATEHRIASEAWLAARNHPTDLPKDPTQTWEIQAGEYPLSVAWDGLLLDDSLHDEATVRPAGTFLARVSAVLDHLFGAARLDWEHDLCDALGVASLDVWLREPKHFFADHLDRYSKSRRQAPIYWPLSTPSGGFVAWLYAPRFDSRTLPTLVNRLRPHVETLRDEREILQRDKKSPPKETQDWLRRLEREIAERQGLHDDLDRLLRWGYEPHPDDGFVVSAAPLHFAFRWAKWRDSLTETWAALQKGDLDWAHLALRLRGDKVLAKCKTDRSLAIAHGREDLCVDEAPKKRAPRGPRAKGRAVAPVQTILPGTEEDE
ncbi:MAG: BREX-1 system adenine-specific DNA-methyltransferase PglX [Polyangiaceae bacterium]